MRRNQSPYIIEQNIVKMALRDEEGKQCVTLFDVGDLEMILSCSISWFAKIQAPQRYAVSRHTVQCATSRRVKGKYIGIRMHKFLVNPPAGFIVDHINRYGLDNRRENLRIVTHKENARNRQMRKSGKNYVHLDNRGLYRVSIGMESEEDAKLVAAFALRLRGY